MAAKTPEIQALLANPDIEGVYETQVRQSFACAWLLLSEL